MCPVNAVSSRTARYHGGVEIDDALSRLGDALTAAGIPLWRPPQSLRDLEELEAEVAPMRVPEVLRQFWMRVDARTLRVEPYPGFITPATALMVWRQSRDDFRSAHPLALVTIGHEGHECMSVELDVGDIAGGALFEWCVSDLSSLTRRFNGLADWIAYIADLVERGLYRRLDTARGPEWVVPGHENTEAERAIRPVPDAHPVHGSALQIGGDILDWPEHWQRANGVRNEDVQLRGATHTIAEVLASTPSEPLNATIAGQVTALAASSWSHVRVDDGTGALDVFCPAETTLLGPGIGRWYEFDIVVDTGPRHVPPDPDEAAAGIDEEAERVLAVLRARHGGRAGATARALRRMPTHGDTSVG